jgi:hypothetical protein
MALDVIEMLKRKIEAAEAQKFWRPSIVLDVSEYSALLALLEDERPKRGRPKKEVPREAVRS